MSDPIAQAAAIFANQHFRRLTLLGIVCQQWSSLEYTFSQVIWHLLNLDDETGKIVTGGLDMLPRANMAINLANHTNQPLALRNALKTARAAIQDGLDTERNRAVHGVPFIHRDWSMSVEVHRGRGGRKKQPFTEEDLDKLGGRIYDTMQELRKVLREYIASIASDMDRDDSMTSQMISEMGLPSDWSPR